MKTLSKTLTACVHYTSLYHLIYRQPSVKMKANIASYGLRLENAVKTGNSWNKNAGKVAPIVVSYAMLLSALS